MKARPYAILAATALLGSQTSTLSAKEVEVEIRRALPVKDLRQGRGADDTATTTPDLRQGRGADDAATATPDVRQGRGFDDTATATPDLRQGRGADDAATATPDLRQARGADDAANATPDLRQGRGADEAVTATPDLRQGRGADDVVDGAAEDRGIVATVMDFVANTPGLGDDTTSATPDVRQSRGADDAALNADGTPHIRQSRGADDAALNADGTPHIRQARGADDAALNADGTPHIRQSRGADDAALNADGTPHIRQARGADDVIANASGALVPTAAALSAPAQTAPRSSGREDKVTFGAAQQAAQTAGLAPAAVHRRNGKHHILEVGVTGFDKVPGAGTADLENGEIIGNLPDKQRLRFALYTNAQQAQAAAALWAAPAAQDKREDGAAVASETGIIAWDDQSGADDKGNHQAGRIMGLFLHSDRMPELNDDFLRGKVIQIYGPQVNALDASGKPLSSTRQVYWTSAPIR